MPEDLPGCHGDPRRVRGALAFLLFRLFLWGGRESLFRLFSSDSLPRSTEEGDLLQCGRSRLSEPPPALAVCAGAAVALRDERAHADGVAFFPCACSVAVTTLRCCQACLKRREMRATASARRRRGNEKVSSECAFDSREKDASPAF